MNSNPFRCFRWKKRYTLALSYTLGLIIGSCWGRGVGGIGLRTLLPELSMRFSDQEMNSAKQRLAELKSLDPSAMADRLASWETLTSVTEIRHLYDRIGEVPVEFRNDVREILISRWVILDPDSAAMFVTRSGVKYPETLQWAKCIARDWAAGRSAEEISGKIKSLFTDINGFLKIPPNSKLTIGYTPFLEVTAPYLDPATLLQVVQKLGMNTQAVFYQHICRAVALANPQQAEMMLAAMPDGPEKRHATLGSLTAQCQRDPTAAMKRAEGLDPAYAKELSGLYISTLAKTDGKLAADEALRVLDAHNLNTNGIRAMYDGITRCNEAAGLDFAMRVPPKHRALMSMLMAMFNPSIEGEAVLARALPDASPQAQGMLFHGQLAHGVSPKEILDEVPLLPNDTSRQIALTRALSGVCEGQNEHPVEEMTTMMNQLGNLAEPAHEPSAFLAQKAEIPEREHIRNLIATQWPESKQLLETLSPEAKAKFLPDLASGIVLQDPAAALSLVEANGGWEQHADMASSFATSWAAKDPAAAKRWAESLSGDARTKALASVHEAAAGWEVK